MAKHIPALLFAAVTLLVAWFGTRGAISHDMLPILLIAIPGLWVAMQPNHTPACGSCGQQRG